MSEYYTSEKFSVGKVKNELDLSNYARKTDLKTAPGADTSKFAKKVDLAGLKSNVDKLDNDKFKNVPTNWNNLKSNVDKLDVDKLIPVAAELSKLSDVVKNDVAKRKVHNAKLKNMEDKIPDITNLSTNTTLNAKMNEVKIELPSVNNLASNASLDVKMNEVKVKYLVLLTYLQLLLFLLVKTKKAQNTPVYFAF